jgi:hypothetical protein
LRFLYVDCFNWESTLGEGAKERRGTYPTPEEEEDSSAVADTPPALERATVGGGEGGYPH